VAWAREQADLARRIANAEVSANGEAVCRSVSRSGSVIALDLANITEELEGIVRSERRALASQIRRLVAHLLKWCYQPDRRSAISRTSILDARFQIEDVLADSPSLARELDEIIAQEYPRAVRWVADGTGIARHALPSSCPWCPWERPDLLDPDFLPDHSQKTTSGSHSEKITGGDQDSKA
jgi:hypothetical protein